MLYRLGSRGSGKTVTDDAARPALRQRHPGDPQEPGAGRRARRRPPFLSGELGCGQPDPLAGRGGRPHGAAEGVGHHGAGREEGAGVGRGGPGHGPLRRAPVGAAAGIVDPQGQPDPHQRSGEGQGPDRGQRGLHGLRPSGAGAPGRRAGPPGHHARHGRRGRPTSCSRRSAASGSTPAAPTACTTTARSWPWPPGTRKGGWSPIGPSEEQLSALRSAEADWFSAASDLLAAEEALTAARNDQEIAKQRAAAAARAASPTPTSRRTAASAGVVRPAGRLPSRAATGQRPSPRAEGPA